MKYKFFKLKFAVCEFDKSTMILFTEYPKYLNIKFGLSTENYKFVFHQFGDATSPLASLGPIDEPIEKILQGKLHNISPETKSINIYGLKLNQIVGKSIIISSTNYYGIIGYCAKKII